MEIKGNVNEYVYKQGTKVEIPAELLIEFRELSRIVVEENSEPYFTDKFKFINSETDKVVKTVKDEDLRSGKVKKIVDIECSLKAEPKIYRKPLAMRALNLQLTIQDIHMNSIEKGDAVHYTELENIKK